MRGTRIAIVGLCGALVVAGVAAIYLRLIPLGVPGEWTWSRVKFAPAPLDLLLASVGLAGYVIFASFGAAALRDKPTQLRERLWVGGLLLAAVGVQAALQAGGPIGHGSMKTVTLAVKGSSGYFNVARTQMSDPWRFWSLYPVWIREQDALHIGTHPPGLFLVSRGLLGLMRTSPAAESLVASCVPEAANRAFQFMVPEPMPRADRSAIALMAFLTLLLCSATVIPLYVLARAGLSAEASWMAATLWPLVPSAILFQPAADTAFPFLACSALACASAGGHMRALLSGLLLALGTQLTLAFFPVGLMVGLVQVSRLESTWRHRITLVLATGAGFLATTCLLWAIPGANPLMIWWWNARNHSRFYAENHRTYMAWVFVNLAEFAVAIGLPVAILTTISVTRNGLPKATLAALLVVFALDVSGKNLSEVARLWILFMPPILMGAGSGLAYVRASPRTLSAVLFILGAQTLALQSLIQVVHAAE